MQWACFCGSLTICADVAFAGAVAGVISDTLLHPFDTVSHRAKVRRREIATTIVLEVFAAVTNRFRSRCHRGFDSVPL